MSAMLREMTKTTWRATLTLLLVLSAVLSANAQSLSMDYLRYIEQWSPLAVRHQQQYGIPATTRRTNVSANTPTRRNRLKTMPASSSANAISRFSS